LLFNDPEGSLEAADEAMTARPSCDTGPLEFMVTLGLLPPYSLDDVKSAYRVKALETHPDRGGTMSEFLKVQEAYERALEYVGYCGDRRQWIADHVDFYVRQSEAAAEVQRLGGQVEFEEIDWMRQSVGDFAWLIERLRVIRLANTAADDAFLTFLAEEPLRTPYLLGLDLAGTRISDKGLQALTGLGLLQRLDLSRTRVTGRALLATVDALPALEEVGLAGASIGWLPRLRLHAALRRRKAENERRKFLSKL
jgi:hypothetical protein